MRALCLGLLLLAGCVTQRGFAPNEAGIPNFDQVDESLFRSAQPTLDSYPYLKSRGVRSVLNLRHDPLPGERGVAEKFGMVYAEMPLPGGGAPSQKALGSVLEVLKALPKPCLVHCQYGCDRTGVVVAAWRVETGWSAAEARTEARAYGLSPFYGWTTK